jgi:nitrogen fixation NifU-like protein
MLRLFIKVENDRIVDIKVETFGCVAAIATSSMTTQMAMGKTIEEAKTITRKAVAEALDGLPPHKMHCSNLAAEALQKAIEDYESRTQAKK